MRSLGTLDLRSYGIAFAKLARFPQLMVGPLLAGVVQLLLLSSLPLGGGIAGAATGGISQLIAQLIASFGLAVALAGADAAWRRDRAPLDEAWNETSRRAGDVFIAALGFQFVVYVAGLVGGFVGNIGALVATLVATFFLIYTLPAAAIGGIPGAAALQVSVERAQRNPLPTAVVVVVYYLLTFFVPPVLTEASFRLIEPFAGTFASLVVSFASIVFTSIAAAYLALVLAKTYADASYGRRY